MCDLDLWPRDPKVDRFMPRGPRYVYQLALKSVYSFSKHRIHKVGNRRTNKQTNKPTVWEQYATDYVL